MNHKALTKGQGPLKIEDRRWRLSLVNIQAVTYMLWGLYTKVLKALGIKVNRAPSHSKLR